MVILLYIQGMTLFFLSCIGVCHKQFALSFRRASEFGLLNIVAKTLRALVLNAFCNMRWP